VSSDGLFKPDLEKTLEHYGVYVPTYGAGWVKILCPRFDHDESRPSATVNFDAGKWNCFVCNAHGDALDLIQYNEGLTDVREAAEWAQGLGIPGSSEPADPRNARRSAHPARRSDRTTRPTPARRGRWH
jgi:DNA primase